MAIARKLRLIYSNKRKTDEIDAENLARLARLDPKLLYPLKHRGEETQAHMAIIRCARRWSVVARSSSITSPRSGEIVRWPVAQVPGQELPQEGGRAYTRGTLAGPWPILEEIGSLTERIRDYDRKLEKISKESYPETELLRQVEGVGPLTALTFVLTLEDPYRFEKSRFVGAYLGLVPAIDQSGDRDPQKRITKEGDEMLRKLLVGSSHYILGPFGSDSDLRRHGEKIASRGRQERQETSGGGRSEEACGALAPPVGYSRGLRSAAQHPWRRAGGGSLEKRQKKRRWRRRGGEGA